MKTIDWKNATPEQINFWKRCEGLIAWTTITPLYYEGLVAGSEFLTYNAGKLYIALEMKAANRTVAASYMWLFNMANVEVFTLVDLKMTDTAGPVVQYATVSVCCVYFSRIVVQTLDQIIFNGYRLNV